MKRGDKLKLSELALARRRGKITMFDFGGTPLTLVTPAIDENSLAICLQAPKDATGGILILLLDDMHEYVSLVERWEVIQPTS